MKQKSLYHPQHKSYPQDPQGPAYNNSDDECGTRQADAVADSDYRDRIRDWQNPSRFGRGNACWSK